MGDQAGGAEDDEEGEGGRQLADAREACQSYGLDPASSGYRSCFDRETKARSLLVFRDEKLKFGPQLAGPK